MNQKTFIRIAAVVMFLAVAIGAIGAHAVEKTLEANGRLETWDTGVFYHAVHGLALLTLALSGRWSAGAFWCWMGGIVLFSGGLYVYSLTNVVAFGAKAAPIGGVLFLAGWLSLAISAGSRKT